MSAQAKDVPYPLACKEDAWGHVKGYKCLPMQVWIAGWGDGPGQRCRKQRQKESGCNPISLQKEVICAQSFAPTQWFVTANHWATETWRSWKELRPHLALLPEMYLVKYWKLTVLLRQRVQGMKFAVLCFSLKWRHFPFPSFFGSAQTKPFFSAGIPYFLVPLRTWFNWGFFKHFCFQGIWKERFSHPSCRQGAASLHRCVQMQVSHLDLGQRLWISAGNVPL